MGDTYKDRKVKISETKWIKEISLDLLRRTEEYQPIDDLDIYKKHADLKFMNNNFNSNSDYFIE